MKEETRRTCQAELLSQTDAKITQGVDWEGTIFHFGMILELLLFSSSLKPSA
jgi:hypothetical protein